MVATATSSTSSASNPSAYLQTSANVPAPIAMPSAVMPPAQFIEGLRGRGLTLRAEGETLVLLGPNAARTDRIRQYLKSQKLPLLDYLRANQDARQTPSPVTGEEEPLPAEIVRLGQELEAQLCEAVSAKYEADQSAVPDADEDQAAAAYGESLRGVYLAACENRLPVECVQIAPGTTVSDPNSYVLLTVARLRQKRDNCASHADYMAGTLTERLGLEALSEWWEGKEISHPT